MATYQATPQRSDGPVGSGSAAVRWLAQVLGGFPTAAPGETQVWKDSAGDVFEQVAFEPNQRTASAGIRAGQAAPRRSARTSLIVRSPNSTIAGFVLR